MLWWKPPNICLIWVVTTHVSDTNIIMAWTTTTYECPNVLVSAPPHPNIQYIQDQIFLNFQRVDMTAIQSPSVTVRRLHRYLNDDTFSNGWS